MTEAEIVPAPPSPVQRVFHGPSGLRAGWRVSIFLLVLAVLVMASGPLQALSLRKSGSIFTPMGAIGQDGIFFADVLIATLIMGGFERRRLADYGLTFRRMFRKEFWMGAVWGFAMLSVIIALMAITRNYSPGTLALSGVSILKFGALWAIGFLVIGLSEESTFRGYVQFTLTWGMGFWPAAAFTSVMFGLAHRGNPGETWVGLVNIMLIAVFLCLALRRTGNLCFAIGWHMAFDWGESFFYSVPDSGTPAVGHLLNATLSGSKWLSGGTAGPEASIFDLLVMVAGILLLAKLYPHARYRAASATVATPVVPAELIPSTSPDDALS